MCFTWTSTSVLLLRSLLVITFPIAAGVAPGLVSRSSRPQATIVSTKLRITNRAMLHFLIYAFPQTSLAIYDEVVGEECCRTCGGCSFSIWEAEELDDVGAANRM